MRDFIPQIEPWIDQSELEELKRVIDSTYVTENLLTKEFEERIKELTGSKYAISIANGTMALFCCLKSMGIGPGDEVLVPNLTFIATSNAVLLAGATPVFCEIDKKTFCLDTEMAQHLVNKKTKAIIPVHLYGQSADMNKIIEFSKSNNLKVIEDAAQGVGVRFEGKHTGTFGDMGVLSFYGNKTITCGEGGVILTNSKKLRDKSYALKNHGRLQKGTFKHEEIGYNFCFTEMQAAIGISQLKKLSKIIERKKCIYDLYCKELNSLNERLVKVPADPRVSPVWWFTSFLTDEKTELKQFLLERGIQTRDFFYPLHLQPCYESMKHRTTFKVSEGIYSKGISLPSSYNLTLQEQQYIINSIFKFFNS